MTWHTSFIDQHDINTPSYVNKVYNSDYMITLDEIPDVYHYQSDENTDKDTDTETEIKKYSIGEVKKGDKITFHLEGTPNAYTNGGVAYSYGGEWVADNWEGNFDSNGKLDYTWTSQYDLSGAEFQIWWAGLWDNATESNLNAESSLLSMDKNGNASSVSEEMKPNTVISRNVPAYSGSGNASFGNDDAFWSSWDSAAEDYLAYDLSGVDASKRKKVIAVWYNNSTYDNIGQYVSRSSEPIDYVIEVNSAAGGTYPNDGWKTVKAVTDNRFSSRQCEVDMTGYNWIRIRVTKAMDSKVSMNFDIHDASEGVSDSWIFFGDSITAGSMVNSYGTSYAANVNAIDSRYYPVQENGGIGGTSSYHGKDAIDEWLADSSAKYVSIAYGTNDAWGNQTGSDRYYQCMKYMINAVIKSGKTPVLPTIPYSTNPDVSKYLGNYNEQVKKLYDEYGDKLVHGPDFYEFFSKNTNLLSDDGVHPSFDGYEAMRKLWAETMYENVYLAEQDNSDDLIVNGDSNCDGTVNLADAVLVLQSISNPDKYGENGSDSTHITVQGTENADVYERGTGLTSQDALEIQKYLLNLVESLD